MVQSLLIIVIVGLWSGVQSASTSGLNVDSPSDSSSNSESDLVSAMGTQSMTLFRFSNEGQAILENNSSSEADRQRLIGKGKESLRQFLQVGTGGPGGHHPNVIASGNTGSCGNPSGNGFCAVPSCGNAQPWQCRQFCVSQSGYDDYACTKDCYCGCITYTYFCNNG